MILAILRCVFPVSIIKKHFSNYHRNYLFVSTFQWLMIYYTRLEIILFWELHNTYFGPEFVNFT